MQFEEEVERALPPDIPYRDRLIAKAARHLELISSANEHMNLTRITDPKEAAVKHIFDSVAPWRCFEGAQRILDAGTGAGFPGVPLSIVLPGARFSLTESIHKKARFVDSAVETLELPNVHVFAERAEQVAVSQRPDVITARAVAPVGKILDLFGRFLKNGTRLLLYKGPDVEEDLAEAEKHKVKAEIISQYLLPSGLGTRTIIELRRAR